MLWIIIFWSISTFENIMHIQIYTNYIIELWCTFYWTKKRKPCKGTFILMLLHISPISWRLKHFYMLFQYHFIYQNIANMILISSRFIWLHHMAKTILIAFTILCSSKFYEQTHIFLRLHIYILHGSDTLQLESATE